MAGSTLHIFAVNTEIDVRHTFLSRSKGDTPKLPDLAGWLSLRQGGLNTDEIDLFPVEDLADLKLSDYVATAFEPLDAPLKKAAPKLNALDGHVLLIPGAALAGDWKTGADLTLVASLPLSVADHSAGALKPTPPEVVVPEETIVVPPPPRKSQFGPAVLLAFVLAVILFTISNFW